MTSPDLTRKRGFILTLGLLTGLAALTVDLSLPAVPAMVEALATVLPHAQLVVGVFMAGMALGQIPAGLSSDRLGRVPVLTAGMTLFAIGGIAAAAVDNIQLLLVARFVQGFGAASAIVLSRAIVRDIASGKEAARLMSLMTMIFTAAPVIAPSIGAILVARWGWRAPFVMIAVVGAALLLTIRRTITETHHPVRGQHPVRQLLSSFAEFFSHRQSIFGLFMVILPPAGFMSVVSIAAAMVVQIYGYSVRQFGLIFACAGLSIMIGANVNRFLVLRFDLARMIGIGVTLMAISGIQLLAIAWLDDAPLWWLWSNVCLYMFAVAIVMPNGMIVALDPLPRIAGVASSIIGTLQNAVGATSAILSASIYNGSVRNSILIIGSTSATITLLFLLKPLIAPGGFEQHAGPARN